MKVAFRNQTTPYSPSLSRGCTWSFPILLRLVITRLPFVKVFYFPGPLWPALGKSGNPRSKHSLSKSLKVVPVAIPGRQRLAFSMEPDGPGPCPRQDETRDPRPPTHTASWQDLYLTTLPSYTNSRYKAN